MSSMNFNKKIRWSEEELSLLKQNYSLLNMEELLRILPKRNKSQIKNKAWQLNLKSKNYNKDCGWQNKWSNEEIKILKDTYSKMDIDEVMKHLPNRCKSGIQQKANSLGLKYLYYNKDYFEKIDSPEKAYWLGFIYADGYVSTQNRFGIELSSVDETHLLKFINHMNSNIRLRYRERDGHKFCGITFRNAKLFNDLIKCGVLRNKSHNIYFPNESILKPIYYKDFIRGFFDGDGTYCFYKCIQKQKYKDKIICSNVYMREISAICLSKNFLDQIKFILSKYANCNGDIYVVKRENCLDLYSLRFLNKESILNFINYIFYDNCLCLERKKEKVEKLLENCLA